jgi:hypothetical protein
MGSRSRLLPRVLPVLEKEFWREIIMGSEWCFSFACFEPFFLLSLAFCRALFWSAFTCFFCFFVSFVDPVVGGTSSAFRRNDDDIRDNKLGMMELDYGRVTNVNATPEQFQAIQRGAQWL